MQQGMVMRTPRGRMLAPNGWTVLGLAPPAELQQLDLLALGAAEGGEEDG
jgi:Holliday junction DNA helicase RuvB